MLEARNCELLTLTFAKRFVEKNFLTPERIITFYDPVPCQWEDIKTNDPGLIVHSTSYLQCFNLIKYNKIVKEPGKYKIDDIKHLNGLGLLVGKRGDKYVTHIPVPIKIDDRLTYVNLYQSIDTIRSIDLNFEGETPYLYLSENDEYLKKFELPRSDSTSLKLDSEYFAYQGFTGKEIYRINKGLIFVKTLGVKLVEKYIHMKDTSQISDQFQPSLEMIEDTIDDEFPLVSQDVLMF